MRGRRFAASLEGLRPQQTVTLCLPLFLAGEGGERRFASEHPTITVDGCDKLCAKRGTEKYSGAGQRLAGRDRHPGRTGLSGCHRSARECRHRRTSRRFGSWPSGSRQKWMLWRPQGRPPKQTRMPPRLAARAVPAAAHRRTASWKSTGRPVTVNGLPLIFGHLQKKGFSRATVPRIRCSGDREDLPRDRAQRGSRVPGAGGGVPDVLRGAARTGRRVMGCVHVRLMLLTPITRSTSWRRR